LGACEFQIDKKNTTAPQGKTTIESQSLLAKKVVFDVFFGDHSFAKH